MPNPIQVDKLLLSNDAVGSNFMDLYTCVYADAIAFDTSAHGSSASAITSWIGPMRASGHVVDFFFGVTRPAISASGFISGTVDATLYINSALVCSTIPVMNMLGTSAANYLDYATNVSTATGTSAVINTASAFFNPGDLISYTWNARSVGSGAAGAAGTGLRLGVVVRYFAQ